MTDSTRPTQRCDCMSAPPDSEGRRTFPMAVARRFLLHIVLDGHPERVFGEGVTQAEAEQALKDGPESYCLGCGLSRDGEATS